MMSLFPCYALQVKFRHEVPTAALLGLKGYEPYVPTRFIRKRWSDRYVRVEEPLLPGYVLCRFDVSNRLPVLCTEGVQGIVGSGKVPVPVDESELQYLKDLVAAGLELTPCKYQPGQKVRLEDGPLAGVEGVVVESNKQHRLIVSISLLQRSVSVEVASEWVRALPQPCLARN